MTDIYSKMASRVRQTFSSHLLRHFMKIREARHLPNGVLLFLSYHANDSKTGAASLEVVTTLVRKATDGIRKAYIYASPQACKFSIFKYIYI